jgi:hypothetical protein
MEWTRQNATTKLLFTPMIGSLLYSNDLEIRLEMIGKKGCVG